MTRLRSWPLFVLVAVIVIYFIFGDDEPAVEEASQAEQTPTLYPPAAQPNPPPSQAWNDGSKDPTARDMPRGHLYPGDEYSHPLQPHTYRFRPLEEGKESSEPYQPYGYSSRPPSYPATPGYGSTESARPYSRQAPGAMNYRFRPLDDESKRWTGNYHGKPGKPSEMVHPYYRNNHYTPPSRPPAKASGANALWANSMPEAP